MPTYKYECPGCRASQEHIHAWHTTLHVTCPKCKKHILSRKFPTPNLSTDSTFMAAFRDDGFGGDDFHRRIARRKAIAAGVNPEGKVFMPGLCREGHRFDPQAWVSSKGDVKDLCKRHNWGCDGTVKHKAHAVEPEPQGPYKPADDLIDLMVDDVAIRHDDDMTPTERAKLKQEFSHTCGGVDGE